MSPSEGRGMCTSSPGTVNVFPFGLNIDEQKRSKLALEERDWHTI